VKFTDVHSVGAPFLCNFSYAYRSKSQHIGFETS
jgi:hypothetical protein